MTKRALITGITGQDGAYLAELLLQKGYEVHGIKRRASSFNTDRIDHLYQDPHTQNARLRLHYGDLTDATNLLRVIQQVQPDEIYNLGAQSHVAVSFETPEYTANADAIGHAAHSRSHPHPEAGEAHALLPGVDVGAVRPGAADAADRDDAVLSALAVWRGEALRALDHGQLSRGVRHLRVQRHPVQPRVADPRRDVRVAQDHARAGPRAAKGCRAASTSAISTRGATGATRGTTCEAQWLMLQQDEPRRLRDRHRRAALRARVRREGRRRTSACASSGAISGEDEIGFDARSGHTVVRIDPRYFRPAEVDTLLGRCLEGASRAQLEADAQFRRAGRGDGGGGRAAGPARRARGARRAIERPSPSSGRRRMETSPAASTSPAIADSSAPPSSAAAARWASTTCSCARARSWICATSDAVNDFFAAERPEYVFLAAGRVGGIHANDSLPADFIRDNLLIATNVIDAAWRNGTQKAAVPRLELHLSEARASAAARGVPADGRARADERVVRHREARGPQDVPGVSTPVRVRRDHGAADESLRPRRQLRPARPRTCCPR